MQPPAPTPRTTFEFEHAVEDTVREAGRQTVEFAYNAAEPAGARQLPPRVQVGSREFRRNRKTNRTVATLFGPIVLNRCIYQAAERGERSLAPLDHALGIVAGAATPALADEAARLNADLTQKHTRSVLAARHGVAWTDGTLRKVVAAMARHFAPERHHAQVQQLVAWLQKAAKCRGKHPPTLAVGRDGVMIPLRPCWEEAACATMSVYDRRGRRLGTVYLGQMPEFGQGTLTDQLSRLTDDVLAAWKGILPRLAYITDAGHHPQEFFQRHLKRMTHPRTGAPLAWAWTVDFFHAAERITTLAEALFGEGPKAAAWAERMRRVLRDRPRGAARVVQAAKALRRARGLSGRSKKFDEACRYLTKYGPHMRYAQSRRRKLPIGSGVTEAACKTIFTQRFKQSGMRWKREQGQHVLDLRTIHKSGVWEAVRTAWLADHQPVTPPNPRREDAKPRKKTAEKLLPA